MSIFNKINFIFLTILSIFSCDVYADDYDTKSNFKKIYSITSNADIAATGASVICAKDEDAQCNWNYNGFLFDVDPLAIQDGDIGIFSKNSAGAMLKLPSNIKGTDILWARLYWQGHIFGLGNHQAFLNAIKDLKKVKMVDAIGNEHNITSNDQDIYYYGYDEKDVLDVNSKGYRYFYQASADITSIVQNSYSPNSNYFIIGNINTTVNKDIYYIYDTKLQTFVKWGNWGGWAMVVAYKDPTTSLKNINFFDGFKFLLPQFGTTSSLIIDLPSNSFYTPKFGIVKSKTIIFSTGAEKKISADKLEIRDKYGIYKTVSNSFNPPNNQMNDTITYLNQEINPDRIFNVGIDLDTYDTSNILSNAQTSTSIKVTMSADKDRSDHAFVGFVGISNDVYQPKICYIEQIYDSNQTEINYNSKLNIGDTITIKLKVKNIDNEIANDLHIFHDFKDNVTTYEPNSTVINNINYIGVLTGDMNQTDKINDDLVDFDQNSKKLTIRLGRDADNIHGGDFLPNDTVYLKFQTKINSDNFLDLSYTTSYTFTIAAKQFEYNGILPKCKNFDNSLHTYLPNIGIFNVTNGYVTLDGIDPTDTKDIKNSLLTQIANQTFSIRLVHLNASDKKTLKKYTGLVFLDVVDATNITKENKTCKDAPIIYELPTLNTIIFLNESTKNISLKIPKAARNATFRVGFIDWANKIDKSGLECSYTDMITKNILGIPICIDTEEEIEKLFPDRDISVCLTKGHYGVNAACNKANYDQHGSLGNIEPLRYNYRYGCAKCLADQYVCARDNFSIRPALYNIDIGNNTNLIGGKQYSLEINATDTNGTFLADGYTQIIDNTFEKNATTKLITPEGCLLSSTPKVFDRKLYFNNATLIQPHYFSYDNVGNVRISLSDNEWTKVDQMSYNGKNFSDCVESNNTNTPNVVGKIGCIIESSKIYNFIPKSFRNTLSFTNHQNCSFTYLSNDINMTSGINLQFSAILDDNTTSTISDNPIATNYTKRCFSNDINYTVAIINDKNLSWSDTINRIKFYNDNNLSISYMTNSYDGYAEFNSSKDNFINGVANVKIYFNFDRNSSIADEPFIISKSDFNISQIIDSAGVRGQDFDRSTDQNITFYYARVAVADYTSSSNTIKDVKMYYEIYCKDCNRSLFPDIGKEDPDGIYWYINKSHNTTLDGEIFGFPYRYTSTPTAKLAISPSHHAIVNGVENHTIKYTKDIFPYKERIDINASSWLYYDRYNSTLPESFTVTFHNGSKWAGIGNIGKTVDLNISIQNSKRIEW